MNTPDHPQKFSLIVIALMKGVAYAETDPALWQGLLNLQSRVRDYLADLGLEMILDESEGYAYLRQRPVKEGEPELPRLIQRRQLSYPVSLLLALLRKKMAEFDARSGDTRLILDREEIVEMVRTFFADTQNSARLLDRIVGNINKVIDLGFLRRLRGSEDKYEVRRILKAFIDAQWLQDFEQRLTEFRNQGQMEALSEEEASP